MSSPKSQIPCSRGQCQSVTASPKSQISCSRGQYQFFHEKPKISHSSFSLSISSYHDMPRISDFLFSWITGLNPRQPLFQMFWQPWEILTTASFQVSMIRWTSNPWHSRTKTAEWTGLHSLWPYGTSGLLDQCWVTVVQPWSTNIGMYIKHYLGLPNLQKGIDQPLSP